MTQQKKTIKSKLGDLIAMLLSQGQMPIQQGQLSPQTQAIHAQAASKDWQYGAGRMAGQMLKQALGSWASNYKERGELKGEKQQDLTELFTDKYGDQASVAIQDLKDKGIWDSWNKISQFDPSSYNLPNSEPSLGAQRAASRATDNYLQRGDWLNPADTTREQSMTWATNGILGKLANDNPLPKAADEQYRLAKDDDWIYRLYGGVR